MVILSTAERKSGSAVSATWAEISLANLRHNFRLVQSHVGAAVTVCAVLKADAYGHGAVNCAHALEREGARWFAVNSLAEAIPLQEANVAGKILLLTGFWRGEEDEIVRRGLRPIVWNIDHLGLLEHAAKSIGVKHPIHLKIDTGMGRLGVAPACLPKILFALKASPHLQLEGVATHFASAEVMDATSVEEQLRRFDGALNLLETEGFNPPLVHAANSSAMLSRPETWHSMVRSGLALYGHHLPFIRAGKEASEAAFPSLKPVMAWKTKILAIRDLPAGQALGYGGTYTTNSPARIAVLPVGYADGLNRQLSSRGRVIVGGKFAPIVGRISMDLTTVDVTGIPAAMEDEVVLLGSSGGLRVDPQEHAVIANTISYEILCNISKLVPRVASE